MSDERGGSGCAALILAALALWYCSERDIKHVPASSNYGYTEDDDEPIEAVDDEEKGGETRTEYESRQDEIGGAFGTYYDDTCTVDCGGHEAGRQWAEEHGITDPSECSGRSWSFQEGCETYAREQDDEESYWSSDDEDSDE